MRRTDHILAFVTTLLRAPEGKFAELLTLTENTYTLDTPRKPGSVSLGADTGDREETLTAWLQHLRAEGIQQVKVTFHETDVREDMPPHLAAAFAGGQDLLLHVTTARGHHAYCIDTYFAPQYEITAAQFITLLDSQQDPALAWARTAELILESNGMNNRSAFAPEEAPAYLRSDEGQHVFSYLGADLVKEVQIELMVHGLPFIIPGSLQHLFVKYDDPFGLNDEREHLYLYTLRDLSARELMELINAQPFGRMSVYKQLAEELQYMDTALASLTPEQWDSRIPQMSPEAVAEVANAVCGAICRLCENSNIKPVIPPALLDAFGPDELEQKRANARSKEKDRWMLQGTQNPWEYYAFRAIDYPNIEQTPSPAEAQSALEQALKHIHEYAVAIDSHFRGDFAVARFVLQASLPTRYSAESFNHLLAQMTAAGIDEQSVDNFRSAEWVSQVGLTLGWEPARIHGLLAAKFSDVFGGMGSWNDQYVEDDQEKYQQVSAELFSAYKNYLATVL